MKVLTKINFLTKQGVRRCSLIKEVERERKHVQKK